MIMSLQPSLSLGHHEWQEPGSSLKPQTSFPKPKSITGGHTILFCLGCTRYWERVYRATQYNQNKKTKKIARYQYLSYGQRMNRQESNYRKSKSAFWLRGRLNYNQRDKRPAYWGISGKGWKRCHTKCFWLNRHINWMMVCLKVAQDRL